LVALALAVAVVLVLAFGTAALVAVVFLVVDVLLVADAFLAAATLLVVVLFLGVTTGFLFFLTSGAFPEEVGAGSASPTEASSTGGVASAGVVSLTSGAGEPMAEALADMGSSSKK